MKAKSKNVPPQRERRWLLFSDGCIHGIRHSEMVLIRSKPHRSLARSSVAVFTLSSVFTWLCGAGLILLLVLAFTGCVQPRAQKGGEATTTIERPGHSQFATLNQSDNPKEPSRQTVQSEQTIEYVVPAGSAVGLRDHWTTGPRDHRTTGRRDYRTAGPRDGVEESEFVSDEVSDDSEMAVVSRAMPVRVVTKDRTETSIGGAQKDTLREWAGKAAHMQPVMWAGVIMMTLVAGVLLYFGWWTKAAVAAAVGVAMIVLAHTLPGHEALILLSGLGVFALAALLVLYAYYKGRLDQNRNGVPDFLEKTSDVPY